MNFENWFNQIELYGLKSERYYDLISRLTEDEKLKKSLVAWLESAYNEGFENGYETGKRTLERVFNF